MKKYIKAIVASLALASCAGQTTKIDKPKERKDYNHRRVYHIKPMPGYDIPLIKPQKNKSAEDYKADLDRIFDEIDQGFCDLTDNLAESKKELEKLLEDLDKEDQ